MTAKFVTTGTATNCRPSQRAVGSSVARAVACSGTSVGAPTGVESTRPLAPNQGTTGVTSQGYETITYCGAISYKDEMELAVPFLTEGLRAHRRENRIKYMPFRDAQSSYLLDLQRDTQDLFASAGRRNPLACSSSWGETRLLPAPHELYSVSRGLGVWAPPNRHDNDEKAAPALTQLPEEVPPVPGAMGGNGKRTTGSARRARYKNPPASFLQSSDSPSRTPNKTFPMEETLLSPWRTLRPNNQEVIRPARSCCW
jgi:hypothetical protein